NTTGPETLDLYKNLLADKKNQSHKAVTAKKDEIKTRSQFCEKQLGLITDARKLFNGYAEFYQKDKNTYISLFYDFSYPEQLKDLKAISVKELTIKDGKLEINGRGNDYGAACLQNVRFYEKVSLEFDVRIESAEPKEICAFTLYDFIKNTGYVYSFGYAYTPVAGFGTTDRNVVTVYGSKKEAEPTKIISLFDKPKIEAKKDYHIKIIAADGVHQVFSGKEKTSRDTKHNEFTTGSVGVGGDKGVVFYFDNIKIEGVLAPDYLSQIESDLPSELKSPEKQKK
ncbi:MAG: hypothetical protein AAB019_03490, partial [Planctomycetota bacterium]